MKILATATLAISVLALTACNGLPFDKKADAKASDVIKTEQAKNQATQERVLTTNSKMSGVTTTASGLQYRAIIQGTGVKPKAEQLAKVYYQAFKPNGEMFDQVEGEYVPVDGVIKGLSEGLQLMSVGSEYEFVIPSSLGYPDQDSVEANTVTIYKVKLLDVKNK